MYLIQIGHYEKRAEVVATAETYEQAQCIAKAEMQCLDPFREWVQAYPDESPNVPHYHIEFKPGFPYVHILTIPTL